MTVFRSDAMEEDLTGDMLFDWDAFLVHNEGEALGGLSTHPPPDVTTAITKEYHFTEPYLPEGNDFHPVPISLGIEFAEICTGPPCSVEDVKEIERRRRSASLSGYRVPEQQASNRRLSESGIDFKNQRPATLGDIKRRRSFTSISRRERESPRAFTNEDFRKVVMTMLEPSAEIKRRAREFTHLIVSGVPVPLTYIRTKIPEYYDQYFLDEGSATQHLHLKTATHGMQVVPVHNLVLDAQCLQWRHVIKPAVATSSEQKTKGAVVIEGLPHLESFGVLLRWLYTNDEDELYQELAGMEEGGLYGFAMNCRFWGVVDIRIRGVVLALLRGDTFAD